MVEHWLIIFNAGDGLSGNQTGSCVDKTRENRILAGYLGNTVKLTEPNFSETLVSSLRIIS
jgi:hypothetical protein